MRLMVMAMLVFGSTMCFTSGAELAPCPSVTVAVDIGSTADVQSLTDALACAGEGVFNITWYSSLAIEERIDVSDNKNVTVTGASPSFGGGLADDNGAGVIIDAGNGTGIFSVFHGSTLRLNNLVLEGGNTEHGGAVEVLSSSSLFVFDCLFKNNNASNGGALFALNSTIFVNGSTSFDGNSAQFGGAIYTDESYIHIDGKTSFGHNSAQGATKNTSEEIASSFNFSSGSLELLSSTSSGGAICVNASVVYVVGETSFTGNVADYRGGAVYAYASAIRVDGKTNLNSNSVRGATTTTYYEFGFSSIGSVVLPAASGGAVYVLVSELGINGNAVFTNNSATDGGGVIAANSSEISIGADSMFTSNSGSSDGGVFQIFYSNVSLHGNTEFASNDANNVGGVILATSSEIGIDGDSMFTNNSAGYVGGVIYSIKSEIAINGESMFMNNWAGLHGGVIFADSSDIGMDGDSIFTNNSATGDGGAIYCISGCNFTIAGIETFRDRSSNQRGLSKAGGEYTSSSSVAFVENYAGGLGGAIYVAMADLLEVSDVIFRSNQASLGGAVYIAAEEERHTIFSECVFDSNEAADGGAVYLNTGLGVDIFNASMFCNNFAETSGGAIFHTGTMHVLHTTFVANKAGVQAAGVMSVGRLEEMFNVSFSKNTYLCRVGEYGYLDKHKTNFCRSCFDEVCSRCSTVGDGVFIHENIRIDEKPVCAEPPLGSTAPSSGTTVANITLKKGYFRTSNKSHDILQCHKESACQGGIDADKYCVPGYTGPYCAVCAEGFAPGMAYSCRECTGGVTISAVGLAVAVGLTLLLFATLLVTRLGSVVHNRSQEGVETERSIWKKCWSCRAFLVNVLPLTAIKIVVTVWQIISQFDAIAGDVYPELYQAFVSKLNPVNLDLDFVFAYSCLVTNDFYDHLLFATITPFLALVVLAGSYFSAKKRNSGSESAMREVRHKHQAAVLYLSFVVYSPVSYKIFQTFGCDPLDDGESYLRADYSLFCLTARHSWYKVYAFLMVGVYPIGIAAAFAGLLIWHRRDLVKPDRGAMLHLKPSSGVWAAYKPSRYYYEVVECGRRISLTVIAAFVRPKSAAQVSIAFLFSVVFVFISEALSPFEKRADMRLYRWGNGVIVASMYVAFLMKVDVGEETNYALLTYSGVLILANVFMVVTVIVQMVFLGKRMRWMTTSVREVEMPVRRTH